MRGAEPNPLIIFMSDTPQTILIQRRSLEDGLRYIIEHAKDVETAIFHIQALYREREREAIERARPNDISCWDERNEALAEYEYNLLREFGLSEEK